LDKDAPLSRAVQLDGRITANPVLGGLHHQYSRIWVFNRDSPKIENLLSFYNEHVDLYVDRVLQDRPITPFS
jgi:hypothetical protein